MLSRATGMVGDVVYGGMGDFESSRGSLVDGERHLRIDRGVVGLGRRRIRFRLGIGGG